MFRHAAAFLCFIATGCAQIPDVSSPAYLSVCGIPTDQLSDLAAQANARANRMSPANLAKFRRHEARLQSCPRKLEAYYQRVILA